MALDAPKFTMPVSIEAITIESLPIDIVAQTVENLTIDIAAQSLGNVDVNIAASAVTINVDVQNVYINVRTEAGQNLTVDIAAQSVGNVAIDLAAQTLAQVDIKIDAANVTGDIPIDIQAQTVGNITVDVAAQSLGNVAVDLAAQTMGNVAIDIAAQTVGNVAISIAAQVVDLNIRTAGGVNIVIDKLTQTAYTERRSTLSNDGGTASFEAITGAWRRGKIFPRGARGFIKVVDVHCKDVGAAGGTITVYIAPYVGAGYLYSATVTVPAGGGEDWRSATFNCMWEYDSLFIFIVTSGDDIQYGYETGSPRDAYTSLDSGATWTHLLRRCWFRVEMLAQTIGDLPVSGTINTVAIPNTSSRRQYESYALPMGVWNDIVSVDGVGGCDLIIIQNTANPSSHLTLFRVHCDGVLVMHYDYSWLNINGFTPSTPSMSLTTYAADAICTVVITYPFEFRRNITVSCRNNSGAQNLNVYVHPNLLR